MNKPLAPAPNRSSNSIVLSFGLVNIPCSVYVSTESVSVPRKEFVKDTSHGVGRVCIDKVDGTVIDRADIVKRAEASTGGVWVELDDDEIAAVTTERGLATIETFIPVRSLGQYETEGLLQVRPKRIKGKEVPGAGKSLGLLLASMKHEKVAALVHVAMRGPARYAILDTEGFLRWVVTSDCIRQPLDLPDAVVTPEEVNLGVQLIKAVGKTTPTLIDTTARTIQAYVDEKAKGAPVVTSEAPPASGSDLLNELMRSIEESKGKHTGEDAA